MNRTCDEILAGPAFSRDQHTDEAVRNPRDHLQHRSHLGIGRDDSAFSQLSERGKDLGLVSGSYGSYRRDSAVRRSCMGREGRTRDPLEQSIERPRTTESNR